MRISRFLVIGFLGNVPHAWLTDVLKRIADHPASKLDELLPWNWKQSDQAVNLAARQQPRHSAEAYHNFAPTAP